MKQTYYSHSLIILATLLYLSTPIVAFGERPFLEEELAEQGIDVKKTDTADKVSQKNADEVAKKTVQDMAKSEAPSTPKAEMSKSASSDKSQAKQSEAPAPKNDTPSTPPKKDTPQLSNPTELMRANDIKSGLNATENAQNNDMDIPIEDESTLEERVVDTTDENSVTPSLIQKVPTEYADKLILTHPETHLAISKDSLSIKGINRYLSKVFVDGDEVELQEDGRFLHDKDIPNFGKNTVVISYGVPGFKLIHIERRILKLFLPTGIEDYSGNNEALTLFFNSDYIPPERETISVTDPFTRAHLAYLLIKMIHKKPILKTTPFSDVAPTHPYSAYIAEAAANGVVSEFPDGTFQPNNPVTVFEFLMSVVKTLGLDPKDPNADLPYPDLNNHWGKRYILTAFQHNLLPDTPSINLEETLDFGNMVTYAVKIPNIKEDLIKIKDFNIGYSLSDELADKLIAAETAMYEWEDELKSQMRLSLKFPTNNQVVLEESVVFAGHIFPAEKFSINQFEIIPGIEGRFEQEIPLFKGGNEFILKLGDKKELLTVYSLNGYEDLEDHWFAIPAAKLQFLGFLDPEPLFEPKRIITRSMLAHYINKFFTLPESESSEPIEISDTVDPTDQIAVRAVITNGILTTNKDNEFLPDKPLTRAEAITAIVRLSNLMGETKVDEVESLAYSDVPKGHWVTPYIDEAALYGLLSPSQKFFPNRQVTKAELITMLSKIPSIQNRLKNTFEK